MLRLLENKGSERESVERLNDLFPRYEVPLLKLGTVNIQLKRPHEARDYMNEINQSINDSLCSSNVIFS